jgi:hypothetical protein
MNAIYELYSDVILLQNIPEEWLSAGDVGTLVEKHQIEGLERGYSVEFFNMLGKTITVVTMAENSLRFPTHEDRPWPYRTDIFQSLAEYRHLEEGAIARQL